MRTRLGLKVLGLSALVMGVMAIGTAGLAQAQVNACFGYRTGPTAELKCFTTSLEAKPVLTIEDIAGLPHPKAATLLIADKNIEITCTTAAFANGGQLSGDGSILLGQVLFGKCFSRLKTVLTTLLTACIPTDPVDGAGTIVSEKGKGLIVLHSGQPVVEWEPDTGTILAKIFMSKECAVGSELIVEGKLILQDTGGKTKFEEHKTTHLIQEFTSLQLMRVGTAVASIDGTAEVKLASPHNALEWGSHGA